MSKVVHLRGTIDVMIEVEVSGTEVQVLDHWINESNIERDMEYETGDVRLGKKQEAALDKACFELSSVNATIDFPSVIRVDD